MDDPSQLLGPLSPLGYPAPYWFLLLFKVLGFTLHLGPMCLWFAGIITSMVFARFGGETARTFSRRLMQQMPLIISIGVNLGIVPLLFTQVAYYRVFYPATILMAWPWLSVIALLTVAYYGVYLYVIGLRAGKLGRLHLAAGWISAVLFICIGFLYSTAMNMMTHLDLWPGLFRKYNAAGAVLGLGMHVGPEVLARWLMVFGLALTTVGAYALLDAGLFAGRESPEYRRAVPLLALKIRIPGLLLFAICGSWYFFGTLPKPILQYLLASWHLPLTMLTALSIGFACPFVLLLMRRFSRTLCVLAAVAQFAALALNAVSRQIVQNLELAPYLAIGQEPVRGQWDVLALFLLLFLAGVGLVVWMILKVAEANRRELSELK